MDPLRLSVALVPLAVYLLAIGVLNFARRTTVVSGGRDLAALAVGVVGLVLVGPIELLLPRTALTVYGVYTWPMVLVLYSLCSSLTALLIRPRLVLYNAPTVSELRPVMASVVDELDADARWAGSTIAMPELQVEFVVENHPLLRTITLSATHQRQSLSGWQTLHVSLVQHLPRHTHRASTWGLALTIVSLAIFMLVVWQLLHHTQALAQSRGDLLP
ncbi:MAG TPA: hypothetical protein VHV77_14895 [Pirellulales bacterium]|nr:hypothetical protein [Pirellulales bacterium]